MSHQFSGFWRGHSTMPRFKECEADVCRVCPCVLTASVKTLQRFSSNLAHKGRGSTFNLLTFIQYTYVLIKSVDGNSFA